MRWREIKEDGRIVKGVNTTVDVNTNEIPRQAAKFGNTVDKDGRPPTLSKKVKGKSTNVLFNLGISESRIHQLEASYEGNLGLMELFKFFNTAPPNMVKKVKKLIKDKRDKEVWKIVQDYTQIKLVGKDFEESQSPNCPRTKAASCQCESINKVTEAEETVTAICVLEHSDTVEGTILLKQQANGPTLIVGKITGLEPGEHGFHIHEFGDLSKGCESAGGHYNPDGVDHGDLDQGHVGDLGNISANKDGVADFKIVAKRVDLMGEQSVVGRAIVVHSDADDLGQGGDDESLKTGNAGDRLACGVITLKENINENCTGDKVKGNIAEALIKRKHKLHKKIKKLTRQIKLKEQGSEVICEINFNSREVAQSALNSSIKCGFEAETVWPDLGEGSGDDDDTSWLDDLYWNRVSDLIYDQEGSRAVERVEEAHREWLQESDYFYELERGVIDELVQDRKEDEAYINDFVIDNSSFEDEIEEYKAEKLAELELNADGDERAQAEFEEYSDWDDDAWAREYIEENKQDEYIEWLETQIREDGDHWDETWERAMDQYDMDEWVRSEHNGSWYSLLIDQDIYLRNEDAQGGGVEEVASMLEDWASNNSRSNDVRAGGYHSGSGVDNSYWRVEEDSSIDGDGAKAEIISPVYDSPAEMLREMKSLFEYMSSNDAETNSSTGLHVTMSMPASGTAETNQLKMALLLGDKYVAKQYGREHNSYTRSQLERIKEYVADLQANIKNEKSLAALEELVSGGISKGKFSSINFKDATNDAGNKLIEFRVAGGEDYHTMMDTVIKTVIRYGAVMQAGHDPAAFRKDYVRALVKLVTNKGDIDQTTQQKAQQLVDPESIDGKVLSAFQTIAGKKHYTDAIEALSDAYTRLADVQKMRTANQQKELQFEDDENADWRRQMKYAQNYFVRAFAMLASDVASGVNRAQPKAAQVAALRRATAQFGLAPAELWTRIQQSEFYKNFPGDVHSKSEKFASAVNSLLKKQEAKALQPTFTVKFNPATQRVFMPGPIAAAAFRDSGTDIFGDDGEATGYMPQTLGPEHFKVISDQDYDNIRSLRYHYEDLLKGIEKDMNVINATRQRQKELPDQASEFQPMIDDRMKRVKANQAEAAGYKKEIDQFAKKYGFVPKSVRAGSTTMGEDWQVVSTDIVAWLSQQYNIRFTANESVFAKFDALPLQEQLHQQRRK